MSDEKQLALSKDCKLVAYIYDPALGDPIVFLEYVEHSQDHRHSNTETSVDLTPAQVREIVEFLTPFAAPAPMTDTPTPHPPTTPHRATDEQWAHQKRWASPPDSDPDALCLLELRDTLSLTREALAALERRVEALEPKQWIRPHQTQIDAATLAGIANAFERAGQQVSGKAPAPAAAPAPEPLIDPADDIVDSEGKPWDRTMNGALWAKAFCRRFGGDEELMLAWFCNAIMAGWDHAHRKMEADVRSAPAQPAGSLVEVVAEAIYNAPTGNDLSNREARAAVITCANWLRERGFHDAAEALDGGKGVGLKREAGR